MQLRHINRPGQLLDFLVFFGDEETPRRPSRRIGIEVTAQDPDLALGIKVGGEDDFVVHAALGLRAWIHFDGFIPDAWKRATVDADRSDHKHWSNVWYGGGRATELRLYRYDDDLIFAVEVWRDQFGWANDDAARWPWEGNGWHLYVPIFDRVATRLFGAVQHESEPCTSQDMVVHMPEGDYAARYYLARECWYRPRSPLTKRWIYRERIEVASGIPFPGKGENSWDCGDDGAYGTSFAVTEHPHGPKERAHQFAMYVLNQRQRYGGGMLYQPVTGWPAHCHPRQ